MAKNGPSEAEFLEHEALVASAAIGRVKTELMENLKRAADPKAWAEKYPLPALGTAAAGGFAAAAVVKPMVVGSKNGHHASGHTAGRSTAARRGTSSTWKRMMAPLLNVAKSSIKSAIIAGITAKAATESAKEDRPPDSPADAASNPYASATTSANL